MTLNDTHKEILKGVRWLVSDPKRWTTGAMARNEKGRICEAYDDKAVCWCLHGAVSAVSTLFDYKNRHHYPWEISEFLCEMYLSALYQDKMSHTTMLKRLDSVLKAEGVQ